MQVLAETQIKPYYEESGIVIYNADCREVLPLLPKVDLVLTDPPYGIGKSGGSISGGRGAINLEFFDSDHSDDSGLPMIVSACELTLALISDGGAAYWWCGHKQFGPLEAVLSRRFEHTGFIVWRRLYAAPQVRKCSWRYVSELCVWGGRPKNFLGQAEMRNVLEYLPMINGTNKTGHPTEKPKDLMQHVLQAASNVGELVLDPFMGSGTTLRAAKDLGRKAIGIEIEERYCEIAANRLRQEVLQF